MVKELGGKENCTKKDLVSDESITMDKRKNCGIEGGKFICKNTEAKTKLSYAKSKMARCFDQTVPLMQCFH